MWDSAARWTPPPRGRNDCLVPRQPPGEGSGNEFYSARVAFLAVSAAIVEWRMAAKQEMRNLPDRRHGIHVFGGSLAALQKKVERGKPAAEDAF